MPFEINLDNKPLYFVTDHHLTGGRSQLEVVEAALKGGVRLVQYRDKELSHSEFKREAGEALRLCRLYGAILLLNDRVEIAQKIGADGVHLGQEDMPPTLAREILGPQAIIGLSTHNRQEVLDSQSQPLSYINIGPIFPTQTKDHSAYPALGLGLVLQLATLNRFPFTTMGGIKRHHFGSLFSQGIRTVAMVTEISLAPDVEQRVRELLDEIEVARTGRLLG